MKIAMGLLAAALSVVAMPNVVRESVPQSNANGANSSNTETKTGTLCVIPDPPTGQYYASVPFDLATLMFRIDDGKKTPWPQKKGVKIEDLKLSEKHLVVVYSWGKPIQSFRFRFSDYGETKLCLLFDGYSGPDLRHMHKSCGCT
jgi:hypothetical protein